MVLGYRGRFRTQPIICKCICIYCNDSIICIQFRIELCGSGLNDENKNERPTFKCNWKNVMNKFCNLKYFYELYKKKLKKEKQYDFKMIKKLARNYLLLLYRNLIHHFLLPVWGASETLNVFTTPFSAKNSDIDS